jgi:predicted DNA-binding WGR domain protein
VTLNGGANGDAITGKTSILICAESPGAGKLTEAAAKQAKGQALAVMQLADFASKFGVPEPAAAAGKPASQPKKVKAAADAADGGAAAGAEEKPKKAAGKRKADAEVGGDAKQPAKAAKKPAAAAAAAAAAAVEDGAKLYLECHEGTSNKFYRCVRSQQPLWPRFAPQQEGSGHTFCSAARSPHLTHPLRRHHCHSLRTHVHTSTRSMRLSGNDVAAAWGAIGKSPVAQTKSFDSAAAAAKHYVKTAKEKRAKGYADAADPEVT